MIFVEYNTKHLKRGTGNGPSTGSGAMNLTETKKEQVLTPRLGFLESLSEQFIIEEVKRAYAIVNGTAG